MTALNPPRRTVLLEVDFVYENDIQSGGVSVKFTHPDLIGSFTLVASSSELARVQLKHLDKKVESGSGDPISTLLDGVNRLAVNITELKEVIGK